ncbi:MAG: 7TM-DISM domain-containing protein, partial [Bacteroidota bacterium]
MTYRSSLLLVVALFLATSCFAQQPKPGIVDASAFDFTKGRLNLAGTWTWYDSKLLLPSQLANHEGLAVEFPGTWNERRTNESGEGYATYHVTVVVPRGSQELAIDMPQIYSSYILFVNGKEIARNGTPGKTFETTVPQWRPQVVPLNLKDDTLRIVLQVANFNHFKGGVKEPITLGAEAMFMQKEFLSTAGKSAAVALLFILALVFLVIYFRSGRKIIVIYFSMLCITWAVRSIFSNDYLVMQLYPDLDWSLLVRVEYITLYLTMIWSILFLCALFKNEGNRWVKYVMVSLNLGFTVFTLLVDPIEFTRLLPLYLISAGLLLVYGASVVLMALINERRGATYLTVSVLLGLAIFSYDIFTYEGWFSYNAVLFSAAYLIIFLLMGGALLLHLDIVKGTSAATTMLTYEDLYGKESDS